ncbi:hypothetical protein K2D_12540 [Planctomycetes bacterium K2D]|uniref:Uncharacterized protein n=1 Tax=Botrimarina mediterranea TaxID=2528022 RepID=A0A518K5M7_9BACT|nr:hypothetical protein Spa11_12920 [Botrimarina mediterranea]QDV77655.1 hypothetical protein K2D_12540 [Planctomycetes bacterium K2D]
MNENRSLRGLGAVASEAKGEPVSRHPVKATLLRWINHRGTEGTEEGTEVDFSVRSSVPLW